MPTAFKQISITPKVGGRLASDISANEVGVANYRVKRDFRRFLDREMRREGHDYFWPNRNKALGFPLGAQEPINLIYNAKAANGTTAVIAGIPSALYRFFALEDGRYVLGVGEFYYFDPADPYIVQSGPDTPYNLDSTEESPYVEDGYFQEDWAEWIRIGTGFSTAGDRWEVLNLGDYVIFNNGVDLPVSYQLNDFEVKPLYELREQGVASVGTIAEFNSVLKAGDIRQIKETKLFELFNTVDLNAHASQTGAVFSETSHATQELDSNVVNIVSGTFVFTVGMVGKTLRFRNGFSGEITAYNSPTQVELDTVPVWYSGYDGNQDLPFYILETDDSDFTVEADADVFTADMVGLLLYWGDGTVKKITEFVDASHVLVSDDHSQPMVLDGDGNPTSESSIRIENAQAYSRITDSLLTDRIRYRLAWSALDKPTRWASDPECSMTAGSRTVMLNYPVKSFAAGQEVVVVGAGLNGGNLLGTILFIPEGNTRLVLDTAALTTVTDSLVMASDMIGGIAGFFDLSEDGSTIIRMLDLNDRLIIYREGGYHLGDYVGETGAPFNYSKLMRTKNALYYKHSLINGTYQGNNFHFFAGRNTLYTFDMTSRLPKEFTAGQFCSNLFFDQAKLSNLATGANLIAAGTLYTTVGSIRQYVFTNLVVGQRYLYTKGVNERTFSIADMDIIDNEDATVDFVYTGGTVVIDGPDGNTPLALTASIAKAYPRSNFVFSADNTVTKEIFFCFPSVTSDKALCFDYDQGTMSTTSGEYTAAGSVLRPATDETPGDEEWFIMGNWSGYILLYGRTDSDQPEWDGSAMWNRLGGTYTSELYSGLGDFGTPNNEKFIRGFTPEVSSFTEDTPVKVELYGAINPNSKIEGNREVLLTSKTINQPSLANLMPVHFRKHYFADRILVEGKDNPCEVSVRTYDISVVRSSGATRRIG